MNLKTFLPIALAALIAPLGACDRVGDSAFDAKVRAYLLEHPEVIEEAMVKLEEKRSSQALANVQEAIGKHRAAIERDERDFVANPNGKITVTEFFDYRCGYCKVAAPQVLKLIAENPDVRFVFKELPIFGGVSNHAAAAALAAGDPQTYIAVHREFFESQNLDEAGIDKALAETGLQPAAVRAKAQSSDVQRHLLDTHALAGALGINGTPTFIVGDDVIPGADMASLKAAIDKARKAAS